MRQKASHKKWFSALIRVLFFRINICLTKTLQTWHSVEWFGRSLIADGLKKLNKEEYQESIKMFSQALDMSKSRKSQLMLIILVVIGTSGFNACEKNLLLCP